MVDGGGGGGWAGCVCSCWGWWPFFNCCCGCSCCRWGGGGDNLFWSSEAWADLAEATMLFIAIFRQKKCEQRKKSESHLVLNMSFMSHNGFVNGLEPRAFCFSSLWLDQKFNWSCGVITVRDLGTLIFQMIFCHSSLDNLQWDLSVWDYFRPNCQKKSPETLYVKISTSKSNLNHKDIDIKANSKSQKTFPNGTFENMYVAKSHK